MSDEGILSVTSRKEEKLEFKKQHNLAFPALALGVKKDLEIYVRNSKTAKEAGDALGNRYQKNGLVATKLYGTRLDSGGDILGQACQCLSP